MGREEFDERAVQISFKATSNGSAVMSEIVGHGEDMIFHDSSRRPESPAA